MKQSALIDRLNTRLRLTSFLDTEEDLSLYRESLEAIRQLDQPECRLCRHIAIAVPGGVRCTNKGAVCVSGSAFKRTTIAPLWKTGNPSRPAKPAKSLPDA